MDAGRIDLERARREAKRRVKQARERGEQLKLADAQLAVARELGEASWPRLVHRAEAEAVAREDRARRLVEEATDGRRDHAEALLGARSTSSVARGSTRRSSSGKPSRVRAALARDPGAATRAVGAREWLPLLYVTHSAFLGGERTDGLVDCARALLDAGADPDSSWQHPEFGALERALRRGRRRARAAHDRAAARGGREPRRRRVRLPRDRDLRPHLPAAAARRRRARRGDERAGARARHRGSRRRCGCCSSTTPAARSSARCCGRSTATARPRSSACSSSTAPTSTPTTRPTSARRTASPGGWAAPTSASCSPSWARGARSGRSTS